MTPMHDATTLPTGTVTFLFSDIEGSTRLVQRFGDAYPALLEQHHAIVRSAVEANGGLVVGTEGDSFFVVFHTAPQALRAAVDAQVALDRQTWPEDGRIRVRMGLHTGEGRIGGGSYVGVDVHRAARSPPPATAARCSSRRAPPTSPIVLCRRRCRWSTSVSTG